MTKNKLTPDSDCGIINSSPTPNALLTIGHYGYEKSERDKRIISSVYPAYRLHFVVKGQVKLFYDGKEELLKKNSVFVLIPNTDVCYTTGKNCDTELYWVTYNGLLAEYYTSLIGIDTKKPFLTLTNSRITHCFYDSFSSPITDNSKREINLLKNFYAIIEGCLKFSAGGGKIDLNKSKKLQNSNLSTIVVQYINNNFTDPDISIKNMAHKFYVHPNYLSTLIKKSLSMTFGNYLKIKRIEFSVQLMNSGITSIKDIAFACGYKDELYYSKVFKSVEGESPKKTVLKIAAKTKKRTETEELK